MENKCKRALSLLLALVMVIGLMPLSFAHAEEAPVYQIAEAASTDLGLEAVGDSAKFVIVSAVTPTREMIANPATLSNGYAGLELATRSGAENAIWTITKVDGGYTVSNGGLNVAIKGNHNATLEADAIVQIKKGNNGTDDWVIYANVDGTDYCLNDHDSFSAAFSHGSAMSTFTNLVGGRSMLKLYAVTEVVTEPEPSEPEAALPADGLLAHYDFETVDGSTVANNVTTNETTVATLNGGAAVTDLDGENVLGNSLQLTAAQDGMQLTNIVNAAESSFSVSMWYKMNATSSVNVNLFQAGTIGGSSGRTILILQPNSTYKSYLTANNAVITTNSVERTKWQHITFVYDKDSNKGYFYINGEADNADGIDMGSTAPVSTSDMIVGRHRSVEGAFNGLIDEVCIYNKALSAEEAKAIFDIKDPIVNVPEPPAPPAETVTLTVDVNDPQRLIDSDSIFGINHRYAFNGYGSFDSATMQIKEDFKALYEDAGFGSIRYPGGTISNLFNWKTTIGPVAERKKQIHGFYNNSGQAGIAPNFGLTEIATFAESVDSEIVYVYSLGRGNAQDAADLIEYLNASVGTNPNGGIDWAAVRAENGHPEPYNVRYFEIGNEMQQAWGGSDGTASQGYWTTSVSAGAETAYIDGGTAVFSQQYAVCEEDWNAVASRSDGSPNLVRYMRYANVNPKMLDENGKLVDDPSFKAVNDGVSVYVGGTQWTVVDSFANSGAADQHVVIDYSTGAIHFGDGVNGAIPASGQQITVSYSVDRQGFLDVSKAIKETTAAINAAEGTDYEAHVYSSFETSGFISKMADRNANEWYDGLTIHPYSGTPDGTGDTFYDSAMLKAENVGIQNVQNYVNMMPADKVPVISEYGIFRSTDSLVRSQTHAIYIAKVLMEYVRLGSPYIQKHCLIDWYSSGADSLGPTQQAVIQAVAGSDANTVTGEGTFTFFSTPSAHVFKMLNSGFGDTIVATEFSETPTMSNGAKTLSALASVDEESNIYIAIVNASRTEDYSIALDLQGISGEGAAVTAQVLTADSYAAQNSPENPNAVTVQELTLSGEWVQTIPKHTFVVLKIDPAGALDTAPVVSGFEADPVELPTKGGEVTVAVTGRNLSDGIVIKSGELTATTTGNSIRQTAVLTFPANTTAENIVHNIQYSLDGAVFEGELSVTVFINRYDADDASRDIPVSAMTATAGDSQSGEGPERAKDNNTETLWHTDWYGTSRTNHWIQFQLNGDYVVDGLRYQPRQDGSINGIITGYDVQVSEDGVTFRSVATGTWEGNASWKIASFGGEQVKYVRLVSTNSLSDNSSRVFASAAEIRLTGEAGEPGPVDPPTPEEPGVQKIFHLDSGRKLFSKDWTIALLNELSAAGYTHLQLAFGNNGFRFVLDDMTIEANGTTYASDAVKAGIELGNKAYHDEGEKNALTEAEMDEILAHAAEVGVEIIPHVNMPGHMNALLDAMEYVGISGAHFTGSVQSASSVDLNNEEALDFMLALVDKYAKYFSDAGSKYFHVGADEYANDAYNGNMGFPSMGSTLYNQFAEFVNDTAAIAKGYGMTPRAWNDGISYGSYTAQFDSDIEVTYWSSGWWGYDLAKTPELIANGHGLINTHGDYYYILGVNDTFTEGTSTTHTPGVYQPAAGYDVTYFMDGSTVTDPVGGMFCVWCDYPDAETETEVAANIRLALRAMAMRMDGQTLDGIDTSVVEGGFNEDGSINGAEAPHVHTEETIPGKAATCTETGLTDGVKCSVCGEILVEQEVIAALGHGVTEIRNAVEATCTTAGYTGDTYCTVCGEKIADGKVIAALGHDWQEDGSCSRCDEVKDEPVTNPFEDVSSEDYYYDAILWAVDNKITNGVTNTLFAPNDLTTRAQIVTFLWRAEGCPDPTIDNPFSDVHEADFYYKAVLWAFENGITKGVTATAFNPNGNCTRAQAVTFVHRYLDEPKATIENPFVDVSSEDCHYNAILWAFEKGVTTGVTPTTFEPNSTCTRGQIVAFLYRCIA